jgi:hypothetical protein
MGIKFDCDNWRRQRIRNFIGYLLVMYGPFNVTRHPGTKFGAWCLDRAANYIYQ